MPPCFFEAFVQSNTLLLEIYLFFEVLRFKKKSAPQRKIPCGAAVSGKPQHRPEKIS